MQFGGMDLSVLESLAECLVLADPDDKDARKEIQDMLERLLRWAEEHDFALELEALRSTIQHLANDFDTSEEAEEALDFVGGTVTALVAIHRDGRLPGDVPFPHFHGHGDGADEGLPYALPSHLDQEILSDFLARQPGNLDEIETLAVDMEHSTTGESEREFCRLIHTLKGEAGLLGMDEVADVCHSMEDALGHAKASSLVDAILQTKDWLACAFDMYADGTRPSETVVELIEVLMKAGTSEKDMEHVSEQGEPEAPERRVDEAATTILQQTVSSLESSTPEDVQDLAQVHALLEELDECFSEPGHEDQREAVGFVAKAITNVILEEDEDPAATIGESLDILQRILKDDFSAADRVFERNPARTFAEEAPDHLKECELNLLELMTDQQNDSRSAAVWRFFHTLRGIGLVLNHSGIKDLAEASLHTLDEVRDSALVLSEEQIIALLDCVEYVHGIARDVAGGTPVASQTSPHKIVGRLNELTGAHPDPEAGEVDAPKLGKILVDNEAVTEEEIGVALSVQERDMEIPRVGKLLVEAGYTSEAKVQKALRLGFLEPHRGKLGEILVKMGEVTNEQVQTVLAEKTPPKRPKLGEVLVRSNSVKAKDVAKALSVQKSAISKSLNRGDTVKVDASRLDSLVDLIGELVIAESMVTLSPEFRKSASPELISHLGFLDKITRELQETGTTLRMVPVRPTFQKMSRLVRDLAKKSGKQIDFVMRGEDTELDKNLVDKIADPLVHLVRNAVDHGVESDPAIREQAGKPIRGTVELRAFHKSGQIYIEIEDDGKGLDRDVLVKKAIERGLIHEDDVLTDKEVWNLIFEPGFSTAKEVTDVSGRGVGMDVVRRNVSELRGRVEIDSKLGKGTTISLCLPLTLAIIDGMVIRCGSERFVLPVQSIVRLVRPSKDSFTSVFQQAEILRLGESLTSLFRLADIFKLPTGAQDVSDGVIVIVETAGKPIGLLVDEVLGQQQIVIKPLSGLPKTISGLAGAAILPDGRVGLILDVEGLLVLARSLTTRQFRPTASSAVALTA